MSGPLPVDPFPRAGPLRVRPPFFASSKPPLQLGELVFFPPHLIEGLLLP